MSKNSFVNKTQQEIDELFMKEALLEAKLALEEGNWPVGCVIVINNKIISRGRNKVYSNNNKIYHAEIEAINAASKILSKKGREATLYVSYVPCPMCMGAILLNHFGRVVYGPDLDRSGGIGLLGGMPNRFTKPKYEIELVGNVLEDDCKSLFLKGKPTERIRSIIEETLNF